MEIVYAVAIRKLDTLWLRINTKPSKSGQSGPLTYSQVRLNYGRVRLNYGRVRLNFGRGRLNYGRGCTILLNTINFD